MKCEIKTDLALENREMYLKAQKIDDSVPGVSIETDDTTPHVFITKVGITSKEGANALNKPMGTYITIESNEMNCEMEEIDSSIVTILSNILRQMTNLSPNDTILVVGLGNHAVTPDALGPQVVEKLQITRHLLSYAPEYLPNGTKALSAIVPGVLGTTGIESSEIVKGIVDKTNPSVVIIIDALASKSMERISKTIQISNTGIIPGSGVGNSRFAITQKELGVPVIVIGVPTVVGVPTIIEEALEFVEKDFSNRPAKDSFDTDSYLKKMMKNHHIDFMVTPKDIDDIVKNLSRILADGINHAFNEKITS